MSGTTPLKQWKHKNSDKDQDSLVIYQIHNIFLGLKGNATNIIDSSQHERSDMIRNLVDGFVNLTESH